MSYERSKIKLTPGDTITTNTIDFYDIKTIDCSDLGGLGLYTDSDTWIAGVKILVTSYGANDAVQGVTVAYGDIHMVLGAVHITNSGATTSSGGIDDLFMYVSGTNVVVRLSSSSTLTAKHSVFVECTVQRLG